MHILRGESPQRPWERDPQPGLLTGGAWRSSWTGRQGRRTAAVGQTHSQPTQGKQMQRGNKRQVIDMQSRALPSLCSVVRWGRDWCLVIQTGRYHKLTALSEGASLAWGQFILSFTVRKRPRTAIKPVSFTNEKYQKSSQHHPHPYSLVSPARLAC